jgi:hypothetical protein
MHLVLQQLSAELPDALQPAATGGCDHLLRGCIDALLD